MIAEITLKETVFLVFSLTFLLTVVTVMSLHSEDMSRLIGIVVAVVCCCQHNHLGDRLYRLPPKIIRYVNSTYLYLYLLICIYLIKMVS